MFEQAEKGGKLGIGLGGGGGEGRVGMDIRLVDTTTGQVVTSRRVEARVTENDGSLKIITCDKDTR